VQNLIKNRAITTPFLGKDVAGLDMAKSKNLAIATPFLGAHLR